MKSYIFFFSAVLVIGSLCAQEKTYHIHGKVLLDEYVPVKTPAASAYIKIDGESKGYLTDLSGNFTIDKLKPGKYKLEFFYINFFKFDTIITIRNRPVEALQITLPMWYDKDMFSVESALENIDKGYPKLYVCTEKKNINDYYTDRITKESRINFVIYEKELIAQKKQFFSAPLWILIRYNNETFRHLDKKYDKQWRNHALPGILGFDEWVKLNP